MARNYNETDNTVQVISTSNGTLLNTFTNSVPADVYTGFFYQNNTLYSSSVTGDSLEIYSYNISNLALKWKYKYVPCLITGSISPLITPGYIIAYANAPSTNGNNSINSKFLLIDETGRLLKTIPFDTYGTNTFIYVDNGVVYKRRDY